MAKYPKRSQLMNIHVARPSKKQALHPDRAVGRSEKELQENLTTSEQTYLDHSQHNLEMLWP